MAVHGLSDRAASKLRDLFRQRAGASAPYPVGDTADQFVFVKCTSATAAGTDFVLAQCYPAEILAPSCDDALPAETIGYALLSVFDTGGEAGVPVSGQVYFGALLGEVVTDGSGSVAGRPRVISIAEQPGGASYTLEYDTLNGDPATQLTQYAVPSSEVTPSSPYYQSVVGNDVGSSLPGVIQYTAPAGSGTTPALTVTTTATQQTVSYTLNSQVGGYTVTESAGDVVFTYVAGTKIDFTNATVTGLSTGARTEGTLAASGSTQGDAAAITVDAVKVSGADNTKGVILPGTAAALVYLWNDDADILNVYPNSGAAIGAGATDAAQSVSGNQKWIFYRFTSTQWYSVAVL